MSRNVGTPRRRRGKERRPSSRGVKEQNFLPKMLEQNGDGGPLWESLWPFLSALDVIRVRAAAKSFNDAKKYGRHAELFFFPAANHAPCDGLH